jgi:hypothetical protein
MGTESFVFENFGGAASLSHGALEDELPNIHGLTIMA